MTIELKGVGRVALDVAQDAEKAVTAMQDFLTAYNDVLNWINTRISEKEVDETVKATLNNDDFRMKWGALYGNSLLRDSKNNLRRLTSQIASFPFTSRTSNKDIYGTMAHNGIVNAGSFTITVGARTATITVGPDDTLDTIAAKINSNDPQGEASQLHYDPDGREYPTAYAKATVEGGRLTISAGTDRQAMLGGNAVLSALGLNQDFNALSQVGLKLASSGTASTQGQSGELDFDSDAFMKALAKNADDVSSLVTGFASDMQAYLDSMIKSSQKEVATGITTAEGAVVREMNAIDEEIKSINKYLTDFENRLKTKQEGLIKQFAAAETSLAKMLQQASWLSSVTSQLQQSSTGQNS